MAYGKTVAANASYITPQGNTAVSFSGTYVCEPEVFNGVLVPPVQVKTQSTFSQGTPQSPSAGASTYSSNG